MSFKATKKEGQRQEEEEEEGVDDGDGEDTCSSTSTILPHSCWCTIPIYCQNRESFYGMKETWWTAKTARKVNNTLNATSLHFAPIKPEKVARPTALGRARQLYKKKQQRTELKKKKQKKALQDDNKVH